MSYRTCESCGWGFHQFRGRPAKRCEDCRGGDRYGSQHRQLRAAGLAVAVGKPCARCHELIGAGDAVDLDHADDGDGYLGFSHASCNARAGAVKTNRARAEAYRRAKGLPERPAAPPGRARRW